MTTDMKRNLFLFAFLVFGGTLALPAQGLFKDFKDNFAFHLTLLGRLQITKATYIGNIQSRPTFQINGSHSVPINPIYGKIDTTAWTAQVLLRAGVSVPILEVGESAVVGMEINGGLGFAQNIANGEGLSSIYLELPTFLYFRTGSFKQKKDKLRFGVLAGYTIKTDALRMKYPTLGLELASRNSKLVTRLESSLYPRKWWTYYSNGYEEPAFSSWEAGIGVIYFFGGK